MAHRSRVLAVLRQLHRVKREVFEGDEHALEVARQKIREEFRKHAPETDPTKMEEALVVAADVVKLMRTSVVQLRQKDDETFAMKEKRKMLSLEDKLEIISRTEAGEELLLRKSTVLPINIPFDPTKEIPLKPRRKRCSDSTDSSDESWKI